MYPFLRSSTQILKHYYANSKHKIRCRCDFFYSNSLPLLEQDELLGVSGEEACHSLAFATCFNFDGATIFFTNMLQWIVRAELHTDLAMEIRSVVESSSGDRILQRARNRPFAVRTSEVGNQHVRFILPTISLMHNMSSRERINNQVLAAGAQAREGRVRENRSFEAWFLQKQWATSSWSSS